MRDFSAALGRTHPYAYPSELGRSPYGRNVSATLTVALAILLSSSDYR